MTPLEILGILSALLSLSAFVLNQYGYIGIDDIRYDTLNMLAGAGLVTYAISIHGVPFIITNTVWFVVSGIDVVKYVWKRGKGVKSSA